MQTIETLSATRGRDTYQITVFRDGEHAGDIHHRNGREIATNRFRQTVGEATATARRWADLHAIDGWRYAPPATAKTKGPTQCQAFMSGRR